MANHCLWISQGKWFLIQNSTPGYTIKCADGIESFSETQELKALLLHPPVLRKLQKNGLQHDEGGNKKRISEIQEPGDPGQTWGVRHLAGWEGHSCLGTAQHPEQNTHEKEITLGGHIRVWVGRRGWPHKGTAWMEVSAPRGTGEVI